MNAEPSKVFSEEWIQQLGSHYNSKPKFQWPKPYYVATDELFRPVRERIEVLVAKLPVELQKNVISRLKTDEHFWQTYHELVVGDLLQDFGLPTEYEKNLGGQTPDWYVSAKDGSQAFIVEVFTQNIPVAEKDEDKQFADFTHRLKDISQDVYLKISINPTLRSGNLTSQRSVKLFNQVKRWLDDPTLESELIVDEFSFHSYRNLGFSSLQYSYPGNDFVSLATIRDNIERKIQKYKGLIETCKIPFLIAVVPSLETRNEFGDGEMKQILFGDFFGTTLTSGALFAEKPLLSGVILARWGPIIEQWEIRHYFNPKAKFPLPENIFREP